MSAVVVTLPDGSQRTYDSGVTPLKVAESIGRRLAEATIGAKVDGVVVDATVVLKQNCRIELITRESKDGLEILRHSCAHLLAQAVKELYPGTQLTIGPVIEDGFYYDVDCPQRIAPDDLPKIEKKMAEIAGRQLEIKRIEYPREAALQFFKSIGENYKIELINGFPAGEAVSAYQQGEFIDLCRGPHIPNTGKMGKFKLLSVAGAYWRGDEKNKMLQRLYGTAWATQKELDEHLHRLEEAKRRDHRRLGPEMGLFTFLPVAPSMPFFLPKGTLVHNLMIDFMRQQLRQAGYQEVVCPQVLSTELWKTSGHMEHYKENMFFVENGDEDPVFALKPMNCPGHLTLFGATKRSYRELPIRFAEFTKVHRNERGGVTHGMLRVRNFSIDDGHIFCTEEQIRSEVTALIEQTFTTYKAFGFDQIEVKLATRPEGSIGSAEAWERTTAALSDALQHHKVPFTVLAGEGAFYGPKIEFHIRDSLGRQWQCGTVQLDSNLPERFGLEYTDSDNQPKRPVMIHRAIWGSLERFFGILVEHHAGHLPFWIAPVQVAVINLTDSQLPFAEEVAAALEQNGFRVHRDFRNEKLGYRIRESQLQKIPYMVVLGQKEVDSRTVAVRKHTGEQLNDFSLEGFIDYLKPWLKPGGPTH